MGKPTYTIPLVFFRKNIGSLIFPGATPVRMKWNWNARPEALGDPVRLQRQWLLPLWPRFRLDEALDIEILAGRHEYQMKQIRILLADDHTVMRRGLRLLLENHARFTVVAEASDGRQAVEQAEATEPDVAVLDIAMPNLSGIEAAQRIHTALPRTATLILSMHSDEGYVLRALKAGAKGYLLKDSAEGDLIDAIQSVYNGKTFFSPEITKVLMEDYVREVRARGVEDSYDLLTAREREIMQLLVELKSNKEIAHLLNLSLYTVETHRRNLHEKLNLHSLPELILYAVRKGVTS